MSDNPLYNVPGLGGYLQRRQMNEQAPTQELQQFAGLVGLSNALQKQQQEQAFRSGIRPGMTQEELATHAARFASPDKVLDIQQKSVDRQEAAKNRASEFAQTLQLRQQGLDQQREAFLQRTEDAQARQRFEEFYKTQSLELQKHQGALNASLKQMGLEIQKQGNEFRLAQFDVKQRELEDKQIEQQIGKTADRMKDVQPVITAAHQLNDILSQYTPKDVPGLGYAKNTDLGKIVLTQEGKNVSSSVKMVGNSILKMLSGTAVTAPEEIRQMAAQMADGRFSAEDFYVAWPKIAKWINDQSALGAAGLTEKSRPRFIERTRLNLDPIKPRFTYDGKGLVDTRNAAPSAPPPPPGFQIN